MVCNTFEWIRLIVAFIEEVWELETQSWKLKCIRKVRRNRSEPGLCHTTAMCCEWRSMQYFRGSLEMKMKYIFKTIHTESSRTEYYFEVHPTCAETPTWTCHWQNTACLGSMSGWIEKREYFSNNCRLREQPLGSGSGWFGGWEHVSGQNTSDQKSWSLDYLCTSGGTQRWVGSAVWMWLHAFPECGPAPGTSDPDIL